SKRGFSFAANAAGEARAIARARRDSFIRRIPQKIDPFEEGRITSANTETALDGAALRNTSRFSSAGLRTHDPDDSAFPGMVPVAVGIAARGRSFTVAGAVPGWLVKSATGFPFNAKKLAHRQEKRAHHNGLRAWRQ